MKKKLLRQILAMSKFTVYGLVLQCFLFSFLKAEDGVAQRKSIDEIYISINLENTRVKEAFTEIERLTDFSFAYDNKKINAQKRIDLSIQNGSLANVLENIGKDANLNFRRVNNQIFVKEAAQSNKNAERKVVTEEFQGETITGRVTAEEDGSSSARRECADQGHRTRNGNRF